MEKELHEELCFKRTSNEHQRNFQKILTNSSDGVDSFFSKYKKQAGLNDETLVTMQWLLITLFFLWMSIHM